MNITGICPYETPCGWCTKWDKKCDKKIGRENLPANTYGNVMSPCYDCDRRGPWKAPECKECLVENNFKYFKPKENNNETI